MDGNFTKIRNDILEELCKISLTAEETRILYVIFRKTYGWSKKLDHISYSQFSLMTGISRSHISRIINKLEEKRIIIVLRNESTNMYGFNKHFNEWKA
jgi:phage replication O-like protein O